MLNNRFHYTIKQKVQIINQFEEEKTLDNSLMPPITVQQVRTWSEKKEEFSSLSPIKQMKTYTLHPGPQLKYPELYTFLYMKVKEWRRERKAITHDMLIQIAIEEQPSIKDLTPKGQRSIIDRFMKLYNLSIRRITSYHSLSGEAMKQEEAQTIQEFNLEFRNKVIEQDIDEENIFNMDQSALYYDNPPTMTIELSGSQQVSVATTGGEKKRVTIISLISCSGAKQRQYIIFKGTPGARIETSIRRSNDDTTYFTVQDNAWTDKKQFQSWLEVIWWPIARSRDGPKLLILDSYNIHTEARADLEKYNTHVMFIPVGMTWCLQPLDSIFHKHYKKYAREFFLSHQQSIITQEEDRRALVIQCVKEIYGKLTEELKIQSYHLGGRLGLNIQCLKEMADFLLSLHTFSSVLLGMKTL